MKTLKSNPIRLMLLAAATLVALPFSLSATPVSWGAAQNISGDSDVSTTGTLVQAANVGSLASTTVNTVVFDSFLTSGGHFSLAGENGSNSSVYGSSNAPFTTLSAAYQDLLKTGNYGFGNSEMDLTISGLTSGDTYQFQVWINDSRAAYGTQPVSAADGLMSVTLLGDTTGVEGGTGQYALLTFIADLSGTETISFQGVTGGTTEEAFQLRDITGAPSVPESGPTMSLLAISLLGLLYFRRKIA